jgi:hypothetical protein
MNRRPAAVGHELRAVPALPLVADHETGDAAGRTATGDLTSRVLRAVHDLDPAGLQARFDLAATRLGLAASVDQVVIPTARQLGRAVVADHRDPLRDLMVTETIRAWLNHRAALAPAPHRVGTILLAGAPRDPDPVGPEALALLLRLRGWPCRVLGPRTPALTLTIAAQAADTAAVVVSCSAVRGRYQAVECLDAVAALGVQVFFAGDAFRTRRGRHEVPGTYLGTSCRDACTLLIDTLTGRSTR